METRLDSPASTYAVVATAIRTGQNISATYNGLPRMMSPHALGLKGDEFRLYAYQFGGESASGLYPDGSPGNYRCMRLWELQGIVPMGGSWHTGPRGHSVRSCFDRILLWHRRRRTQPADEARMEAA